MVLKFLNDKPIINRFSSIRLSLNINERLLLFIFIAMFCIHGTDIKIGFIKISELFLLVYFFFIFGKLNKYIFWLMCLFCVLLINSLVVSAFTNFYPPSDAIGGLRQPYLISISRFLELIACLSFAEYIRRNMQALAESGVTIKRIFNYLVIGNCILGIVYLIDYFAILLNIYSIDNSIFFYDQFRLKGTFGEGGPHGLCIAFLLCICTLYCNSVLKYLSSCLFFILIFLSQSKAGIIMLIIFISVYQIRRVRIHTALIIPLFLTISLVLIFIFSLLLNSYIASISNLDTLLITNRDDPNFMMGRISGLFIVPSMILNNFWFGIGLGNYSLVRNNPLYRNVFPEVTLWDSPGLGGLIDLLIETGFIGLLLFVLIIGYIYKKIIINDNKKKYIAMCFLLPYICGVQIYFQYPWFALGYFIFMSKTNYSYKSFLK